jgi:hypothetical protein
MCIAKAALERLDTITTEQAEGLVAANENATLTSGKQLFASGTGHLALKALKAMREGIMDDEENVVVVHDAKDITVRKPKHGDKKSGGCKSKNVDDVPTIPPPPPPRHGSRVVKNAGVEGRDPTSSGAWETITLDTVVHVQSNIEVDENLYEEVVDSGSAMMKVDGTKPKDINTCFNETDVSVSEGDVTIRQLEAQRKYRKSEGFNDSGVELSLKMQKGIKNELVDKKKSLFDGFEDSELYANITDKHQPPLADFSKAGSGGKMEDATLIHSTPHSNRKIVITDKTDDVNLSKIPLMSETESSDDNDSTMIEMEIISSSTPIILNLKGDQSVDQKESDGNSNNGENPPPPLPLSPPPKTRQSKRDRKAKKLFDV